MALANQRGPVGGSRQPTWLVRETDPRWSPYPPSQAGWMGYQVGSGNQTAAGGRIGGQPGRLLQSGQPTNQLDQVVLYQTTNLVGLGD